MHLKPVYLLECAGHVVVWSGKSSIKRARLYCSSEDGVRVPLKGCKKEIEKKIKCKLA